MVLYLYIVNITTYDQGFSKYIVLICIVDMGDVVEMYISVELCMYGPQNSLGSSSTGARCRHRAQRGCRCLSTEAVQGVARVFEGMDHIELGESFPEGHS